MNRPALRFMTMINRLDKLFYEASIETEEKRKEILLSSIIVKLHDQWNFRSRQIVLKSFGRSEGTMMEILRENWAMRRMDQGWEPDWHMPQNTIRAARLLNVPDLMQIQSAIGAVTYIDDVRWTRNAIIHNIPTSFKKFREMILIKYRIVNIMPYNLVIQINSQTGNTIYEDWCIELQTALKLAI